MFCCLFCNKKVGKPSELLAKRIKKGNKTSQWPFKPILPIRPALVTHQPSLVSACHSSWESLLHLTRNIQEWFTSNQCHVASPDHKVCTSRRAEGHLHWKYNTFLGTSGTLTYAVCHNVRIWLEVTAYYLVPLGGIINPQLPRFKSQFRFPKKKKN